MAPLAWSPADDARLRQLARTGIGSIEIAVLMGRTKGAIRARAEKMNIAVARQQNAMQVGKRLFKGEPAN